MLSNCLYPLTETNFLTYSIRIHSFCLFPCPRCYFGNTLSLRLCFFCSPIKCGPPDITQRALVDFLLVYDVSVRCNALPCCSPFVTCRLRPGLIFSSFSCLYSIHSLFSYFSYCFCYFVIMFFLFSCVLF
jgi:hypothetical protein